MGPGMIKSPALDVANLAALIRQTGRYRLGLIDQRVDVINASAASSNWASGLFLLNQFSRCFDHLLKCPDHALNAFTKNVIVNAGSPKADFFIFSISVLEQFSLQYLIVSLCLAKALKVSQPCAKIVFFGNCPKKHARKLMAVFSFVDAFLEDGNEFSLLDYLGRGRDNSPVKGVIFRADKGLTYTDERRVLGLNKMPRPYFGLFDLRRYSSSGKVVLPYEISRGCANKCFFCYYIHKGKLAHKDIGKVTDDLAFLSKKYKTNYFHFMDAAINSDEAYLNRLCPALRARVPKINWSALAIPNISKRLLISMKAGGCRQLRWGVEYASPKMLKLISKKTTLDSIIDAIKNAHELGIYNYVTLLSGLKQEAKADIDKTNKFLARMHPYIDSVKECVWGELGHFSLAYLEALLCGRPAIESDKKKAEQYASILKKLNIPSEDIIEVLTAPHRAAFIISPQDSFPGGGTVDDDGRSLLSIFKAISLLKARNIAGIEYLNFLLLFGEHAKIQGYFLRHPFRTPEGKERILVELMAPLVKKSSFYFFYISWWDRNLRTALALARYLKKAHPSSKIIFWGPHCNFYSKEISRKYAFIDKVLRTDAPETILELLEKKATVPAAPGLMDYSMHIDFLAKHGLTPPVLFDYETSCGCKHNCFYCSSLSGKALWFKDIFLVSKDLRALAKLAIEPNVYFHDDALNMDNGRLGALLDIMAGIKPRLSWSCYMIAKDVSEALLKKMAYAGCRHIRWGIETLDPYKQRAIDKGLNTQEIAKILFAANRHGIDNQISVIVGFPYECSKDLDLAIDFITNNRKNISCVNVYQFKLRRNSPIYAYPGKFGISIDHTLDSGSTDGMPFSEKNGLPWQLKKSQQEYISNILKLKVKSLGLIDQDPRIYFSNLVRHA